MLDRSIFKTFPDSKRNVTEKLNFFLGRIESTVGKGENAGYQHFLLFPHGFLKASITGSLKVMIVCKELTDTVTSFKDLVIQTFQKHCGKRRKC